MPMVFMNIICTLRLKVVCSLEILVLTNLITTLCHNPEDDNINTFSHKIKSLCSIFSCDEVFSVLTHLCRALALPGCIHLKTWELLNTYSWNMMENFIKKFMSLLVLKLVSGNERFTWRLNAFLFASPANLPKYFSEQKMVSVKVSEESEAYVFTSVNVCCKCYLC